MRVLVVSDTHGLIEFAVQALKEAGAVDLILHAGDHYRDGKALAEKTCLPVRSVAGNCDSRLEGPLELMIEVEGQRILLTHGHTMDVKKSGGKLLARAEETGAGAVVYGHTHAAGFSRERGILLFNPGSVSIPRDGHRPSYGILEVTGEGIFPFVFRL
ncbi:MAG: metallophosphoesterase [Firmicutes bacterium]|nr:metallophosphoesterase [Bacillota bacterium]